MTIEEGVERTGGRRWCARGLAVKRKEGQEGNSTVKPAITRRFWGTRMDNVMEVDDPCGQCPSLPAQLLNRGKVSNRDEGELGPRGSRVSKNGRVGGDGVAYRVRWEKKDKKRVEVR